MTRALLATLLTLSACGSQADTGDEPGRIIATCDAIECVGASSQQDSDGNAFQSTTCVWECIEWNGQMQKVTATYAREVPECFFEANVHTEPCG